MSKKSPAIAALLEGIDTEGLDPHYAGFFACFNRGLYFEAHDVLEELWLVQGRSAVNYAFHKGLIQLAGAFVHLQKNRLKPSVALFRLAKNNFRLYPTPHQRLDLDWILSLIQDWRTAIESGDFKCNPLDTRSKPHLKPLPINRLDAAISTVPLH
ncbi:MAG: DUF309 domain-containing protein [Pedosphaera sp.]|nr:DUF309 domain-containing protein [Pedosphaera sp.]